MNNKLKKAVYAICTGLALATVGGCATTQVTNPDGTGATSAQAGEQKVLRALPSYGTKGGYRYRRFTAVAVVE